jgi:hypothetical protein
VHEIFDDDGNLLSPEFDKRIDRFLDEFYWYLEAFKTQRKIGTPY